jgi:hypothetical protein
MAQNHYRFAHFVDVDDVLRENGTFFEFSLFSSRACLGKMLIFIYKWLEKCRFLTFSREEIHESIFFKRCEKS